MQSMDRVRNYRLPSLVLLSCFLLSTGCASKTPTLRLQRADGKVAYAQTFDRTYASKSAEGSWSFVLLSDETTGAKSAQAMPLRQVVHVKILWRPMSGTGRDTSVANAAIDWYVLSNSAGADDLLLYQGCGHVTLDPGDKATKVTIRSATVRPSVAQGKLADPLGEATLSGKFVAINDGQRAQRILSDARSRTASIASSQ